MSEMNSNAIIVLAVAIILGIIALALIFHRLKVKVKKGDWAVRIDGAKAPDPGMAPSPPHSVQNQTNIGASQYNAQRDMTLAGGDVNDVKGDLIQGDNVGRDKVQGNKITITKLSIILGVAIALSITVYVGSDTVLGDKVQGDKVDGSKIAANHNNVLGNMIVAGGDVHAGIDPVLYGKKSEEVGELNNKYVHVQEESRAKDDVILHLEEQLAQMQLSADSSAQRIEPTQKAKGLAKLISGDDGPYALALKAIADGNNEQADRLLDEAQQTLDSTQDKKDRAQVKISMARMQNACYAGRYRDAVQWCKKLEPFAGENPIILNSMAMVYYENAAYQMAEPLYRHALDIREKTLGPEHPDVATSLNNLAELYRSQAQYGQAEPLFERSRAIWEKALGPEHSSVAMSMNNLAQLYSSQGQYGQAESLFKQSRAIWEKAFGLEQPCVATSLNNLAELYKAEGRYVEAEDLLKRARTISEKTLGPGHPDVARSMNNLAGLYFIRTQYAQAEPLFKESREIWEKAFGPDHPLVATSLGNLAALYRRTGREKEAEALDQRAAVIREIKR